MSPAVSWKSFLQQASNTVLPNWMTWEASPRLSLRPFQPCVVGTNWTSAQKRCPSLLNDSIYDSLAKKLEVAGHRYRPGWQNCINDERRANAFTQFFGSVRLEVGLSSLCEESRPILESLELKRTGAGHALMASGLRFAEDVSGRGGTTMGAGVAGGARRSLRPGFHPTTCWFFPRQAVSRKTASARRQGSQRWRPTCRPARSSPGLSATPRPRRWPAPEESHRE